MTEENLSEQTEVLSTKVRPAENLDERTVEEQKSTLRQFYSEIEKGVEAGTIKVLNKENTKGKRLKASVTDTHGDVVSLIVSLVNCGARPEENKFLYYLNGKYYCKDESETGDKKYHEYNPYGNPKIGDVVEDETIIKNIENNSTVVPFFNTANAIELNHLGDVVDKGFEGLTSILICETCDNLKLIQGNHEFSNDVKIKEHERRLCPVIDSVLARMKKNKKIAVSRHEGKGNKVVAYSHTPLTQIGISCIFDFLNDYIRGDLFDENGNEADLSVKSNVFNALDKEFKNHKNLFNKLQTFLLNCEKSDFKDSESHRINKETEKKLTDFYKKIIDEGNFTKEELLIIKNIVGDALDNRKINDDGKKKFGESFAGNYQFSKLILYSSERGGDVNVLNFYDKEYNLSICEHVGGHSYHENSVVVNKENNDKKLPKKKVETNKEANENGKVLFVNGDILRTNGSNNHKGITYALTTVIDEDTGEVENYTCIVDRGRDNEILNIRENKGFKCPVTKLENYITKPFEKDKTEFYDFVNDVNKTIIDKNGKITITFNNNQEITLNSLNGELDCIGRSAIFAIFANENNLDINNEKHKGVIDSLLSTLMEQENNDYKRNLINMVLSNCHDVNIISYIFSNEKVKNFIEENKKNIEKNKETINENKEIISGNEKTINENKEIISGNEKTIIKNRKIINGNEELEKESVKLKEKNEELEKESVKLKEKNEELEKESVKLTKDIKFVEKSRTIFLNAFLLNKEIFNRGDEEEIDKVFELIGIENFAEYFKENIANNKEEKNKFFSMLINSDNSYLLEYLGSRNLLNKQDCKILLEKGVVYNRMGFFDGVCKIANNLNINLFENDSLKNNGSKDDLSEEESKEKIKDLLESAIENENVDIFDKIFNTCTENNLKIEVDNEIEAGDLLKKAICTKNKELIDKVVKLFKSKNISVSRKKQNLQNLINTTIFSLCSETDKTNEEENKYVIDIFKKLNNVENISDIDFSKIDKKHDFLNVVLATNDSALIKEVIGVFEEKKYLKKIDYICFTTLLKDTKNIDVVKKLLDIYKNQNPEEFKNLITNKLNLKNFLEPLILANNTEKIKAIFNAYINNAFEVEDGYDEKNVLNLLKLAIKQENMEIFNNMIGAFENKSFKYGLRGGGSTNKKNLKELLDFTNDYESLKDEAKETNNAYVIKTVEEKLNEIKNGKKEELGEKAENNEEKINDNDIADNSSNNPNSDSNTNKEEQSEEKADIINSDNGNLDSDEISEEAKSLGQLILDLSLFSKCGKKREKGKNLTVYKEEKKLINRYNSYVEKHEELKLKIIKIKEKNKFFHKKNYYMYIRAEELNNVIKALSNLNTQQQQQLGDNFDINGMWF